MATANIAQTKIVPVSTTLTPYYDDFDENKNYHRILFRPGYAVQARELTQLQTILQNQVERFGNHIFQNGSLVLGGQMSLDRNSDYINLQSTYANTSVIAADFKGNTITHSSGNAYVRAYVFGTSESTSTEPPVLVLKYFTGNEFGNTATIKTDFVGSNAFANIATSDHTGKATTVSINDGIFFINGYFVKVPQQTIVVDKYSTQANAKVGLEYSEEIITDSSDTSLLDPAQEASNYQAPGAARLQINFDLATRALDSEDDTSFVEMMRIENGIVKKQIKYPLYSEIGDTMARRTYDESGDYTVRRFTVFVEDHPTDNTKLNMVINPGKAYVKGYEYENIAQEKIAFDKARDFVDTNNKDATINFGNYLYVNNVAGAFNVATMEIVDLHSVTYNLVSSATHAQTKIGTARTREIKYYGASDTSDANTFTYALSLFDTRFSNLTSNVVSSTTTTVVPFDDSDKFSPYDNAYNGATLRFTSGTGVGQIFTVSDYTGSTKTFTVTPDIGIAPDTTTLISLDFNSKMIDSLSDQANTRSANVSVISKDTGTREGNTSLLDTTYNGLIFSLPDNFVKAGLSDQSFSYYGVASVTFTANAATITISGGETFAAGNGSLTGTSTAALDGFQVFRTNGERLNLSTVSINNGAANPTATITNSDNFNSSAIVYFLINANSGSAVGEKTKSEITGNTSVFIADGTLSGTFATTLSQTTTTTNVYLTDAQVTISSPSKVSNEKMSLFVSDVKGISKIYDLNGAAIPSSGASLTGYNDVTSYFIFDNGQRDTHYDHASISLLPRNAGFVGPLIVVFDYYSTPVTPPGYFSVDSYPSYEDIPEYNGISLRDAIDFRPVRRNASNTTPAFTLDGVRLPKSGTSFQTDYSYYLPKKAHLILSTDFGQPFKVVSGISSRNPIEPRLTENSMLLYKLTLDPYTINSGNVNVRFVENKRYTMRDIGALETRIQNLEYYQSLTLLETAVSRMTILDENGLERTKYGFIADDFTTHGYGKVESPDYLISVDRVLGGMQPAQNVVGLTLVETANTGTKQSGPYTTLSFTEEKLVSQNIASKFAQVQPYMIAQWVGNMFMDPPDDYWTQTSDAPYVAENPNGENDALELINILTLPNTSSQSSRALGIRANNAFATETNWWTRWFATPIDRS
jgi:hypothetical protein